MPCPRKLTNEQVYAIRCRYIPHSRIDGMSALAKAYGVGSGTIEGIVKGLTYKEAQHPETQREMPSKMITPEVLAFVRRWYVPCGVSRRRGPSVDVGSRRGRGLWRCRSFVMGWRARRGVGCGAPFVGGVHMCLCGVRGRGGDAARVVPRQRRRRGA